MSIYKNGIIDNTMMNVDIKEKEGASISIDDSEGQRIFDTELVGETSQDTYSGKNLLGLVDGTYSSNSVNAVVANGEITLTGTATGGNSFIEIPTINNLTLTNNSQYTVSINNSASNSNVILRLDPNTRYDTTFNSINKTNTITYNSSYALFTGRIAIRIAQGTSLTNYKIKPQLELGSTATSYEQYVGGTPSPNSDYPQEIHNVSGDNQIVVSDGTDTTTYNIDLPVENKLNKDGGFTLQGMNTQGGLVSNNTNVLFNGYIDVLPNTSYTLSTNAQVATLTIAEYNGTTFVIRKQANNVSSNTITTGLSTNKVRIIISKDSSTTMTQEIIDSLLPQLEEGTKANTYVPYGLVPIGENLFDKNNVSDLNAYFTANDPTITSSWSDRVIYIPCQPNTTYTISKKASSYPRAVGTTSILPALNSSVENPINMSANSTIFTYTTNSSAKYLLMRVWNVGQDSGTTYEQIINSIRIEEGTISHKDYHSINLNYFGYNTFRDKIFKNSGKNLFDYNTFQTFTTTIQYVSLTLKPNTQYTMSSNISITTGVGTNLFFMLNDETASTSTNGVRPDIPRTLTTDSTGIVKIGYRTGTGVSSNPKIDYWYQIEVGNQASTYEPYGSGDWYVAYNVGKYRFMQGETFYKSNNLYYCNFIPNMYAANTRATTKSEYFRGVSVNDRNTSGLNITYYDGTALYYKTDDFSTLDEFKNFIYGKDIWFMNRYTDYQKITYQPLIDQLNAIQNDSLLEGTNHITIEPNDLTPTLKFSYSANINTNKTQVYQDKIITNDFIEY